MSSKLIPTSNPLHFLGSLLQLSSSRVPPTQDKMLDQRSCSHSTSMSLCPILPARRSHQHSIVKTECAPQRVCSLRKQDARSENLTLPRPAISPALHRHCKASKEEFLYRTESPHYKSKSLNTVQILLAIAPANRRSDITCKHIKCRLHAHPIARASTSDVTRKQFRFHMQAHPTSIARASDGTCKQIKCQLQEDSTSRASTCPAPTAESCHCPVQAKDAQRSGDESISRDTVEGYLLSSKSRTDFPMSSSNELDACAP